MHILGEVFFHRLHAGIYGISYLDVVGSGLWNNNYAYHRHTVHLHVAADIGCAQFGTSDIAETDDAVVHFFDDEVVEFIGRSHQAQRSDGKFSGVPFNASRGELYVFTVYSALYVHRRDAIARHLNGVEPQTHRVAFFSPDGDAAYIGDCL